MKALIQRVLRAEVRSGSVPVGEIGPGLLVLLGVALGDTEEDARWLAEKCVQLRIFDDQDGKMNHSLLETGGGMLVISQFTLLGDCRKGRRPSWHLAAPPETAQYLYNFFIHVVSRHPITVACGQFQAMMEVDLINHGPVTLLLDSKSRTAPRE